jgi:hypothetical protein
MDKINLIPDLGSRDKRIGVRGLTPKSILEIWYGSRGLHLIGAPIHVFSRFDSGINS